MIYDLLIVFSSPPIENSRIDHFTDLLHDFTEYILHILTKYAIKLAKNLNSCANRLVVEGTELNYKKTLKSIFCSKTL